jgi:TRAP-type uncharacterized transport system fused permease subunit
VQGWLGGKLAAWERALLILAGLALVYPAAWTDVAGFAGIAIVVASRFLLRRTRPAT